MKHAWALAASASSMHRVAMLLAVVVAAAGCSDDPGVAGPVELDVAWQACAANTGATDTDASCAEVAVPLDWNHPEGETITYFVKRLGPLDARKHLWLLQGGPGAAGDGLESVGLYIRERLPDVAVMIPDHRGTGRSTRLACPDQESASSADGTRIAEDEWPLCLEDLQQQWGIQLGHFNTSQAARDISAVMGAIRAEEVVVFGVSYGTFLAQRYLSLFPDEAAGVALAGIVNPTFDFNTYDQDFEAVGMAVLQRCADDAVCSSKLGGDPAATISDLYGMLDAGHCPEAQQLGFDRAMLKRVLSVFLLSGFHERALSLAVAYRLLQCRPGDVDALAQLASVLAANGFDDPLGPLYSRILRNNIVLSEMWQHGALSVSEAETFVESSIFALGSSLESLRREATWPTYEPDAYDGQFADISIPLLMVQGDLDPATPLAQARLLQDRYRGPHQTFVTVPDMPHGLASPLPDGSSCALNMLVEFVATPAEAPTDCSSEVVPLTFTGLNASAFGTADLWD